MSSERDSKPRSDAASPASMRGVVGEPEAAISYIWQTPVRRPKKQTGEPAVARPGRQPLSSDDRARLERIVARAPEVMVKVTGRAKAAPQLVAHFAYITREGQLSAETEEGVVLTGRADLHDLQSRWVDDVALDSRRRIDGNLSINLILSMPPGTDPMQVREAVRAFAREVFLGQHDFVFVRHEDEAHPHVHLTVRALGYDGSRLNPQKADLHHWRERFAAQLRLLGISAEASPRRARGQIRKAERGALRAMRERGVCPRVDRLARQEVVQQARGGEAVDRPWEKLTAVRQTKIRARYAEAARHLAASDLPADHVLSTQIQAFVEGLPEPTLQRHALMHELAAHAETMRAARVADPKRDRKPDRTTPALDPER